MKPPYIRPPSSVGDQVRVLLPHLPNDEIAAKLNCSAKYVAQCRRGGVPSRPARPGDWTAERIDALKRDWAAGLSCSQIAARLGGVTRNAVIGKVSRLGLPRRVYGREAGYQHIHRAKPKVAPPPKPLSPAAEIIKAIKRDGLPIPPPAETDIPRVATVDLENHHCRWPCVPDTREVSPFDPIFCGSKRVPGASYCAPHLVRATSAPPPRRRELPIVAGNEVVAA